MEELPLPFMNEPSFNQAISYEKNSSEQRQSGQELIQSLAPEKGQKVLDLGCGTGFLSEILADVVGPEGRVVAIDPDVERLTIARKHHAAINLEYLEGSSDDIPGSDYDLVFSNYVLHWIENKELLFKHVAQILKKGGKFGFIATCASQLMDQLSEDVHSKEFIDGAKNCIYYTSADEFKWLAESNGFVVKKFERIDKDLVYQDVEHLKKVYLTHLKNFTTSDINSEAMVRKFGCGNVHMNTKDVYFILAKQ